jgi:uncharacterized Zn finger protein
MIYSYLVYEKSVQQDGTQYRILLFPNSLNLSFRCSRNTWCPKTARSCAYYAEIGYPELSSGELLKAARTLTDKPVFFDGKLGFENRKQSLGIH